MEADEIMRAMRLSCFQLNNSLQRTFYDVSSQISGAVMASAGHKSTRVGKVLGGRIGVVVSVVLLQSAHMVSAYIKCALGVNGRRAAAAARRLFAWGVPWYNHRV